jgi:hypothetical protein
MIDDSIYEGNETFTASLSGASGASLGSPTATTVTIIDNETPPRGTLQFASSTYSVNENGGSVQIYVSRTGGSYGAASVSYGTANGTATAGSDYTAASGTLSWADGDTTSKSFAVPMIDDSIYEGNETFTASLSGSSGASLGSPSSATVTIVDNETPPPGSMQLSSSTYSVNENGGTVTLTATRTGGSYGAASVNYGTANGTATAGADYTTKSGTLNWADGDAASKTFTVTILDDAVYEGNETFAVNLSGASGASLGSPASATVTIVDNETPSPSFGGSSVIGGKLHSTLSGLSSGATVVLQVSSDLKTWTPIQTNTVSGSTLSITNTINPAMKSQFFRALVQ